MPTIFMSGEKIKQLIVCNPDAGARTGRWCAALPGLYPDRCDRCFDRTTMEHYPATAFVTQKGLRTKRNPTGKWRHGVCQRCSRLPVFRIYMRSSVATNNTGAPYASHVSG